MLLTADYTQNPRPRVNESNRDCFANAQRIVILGDSHFGSSTCYSFGDGKLWGATQCDTTSGSLNGDCS